MEYDYHLKNSNQQVGPFSGSGKYVIKGQGVRVPGVLEVEKRITTRASSASRL